ncbi:MAG: helix-turn-helix domain-containing protein [Lentisphaeria bacterium]|nr:helix-turn-helix domain-containing protein [Lentisphaeria bacterium]
MNIRKTITPSVLAAATGLLQPYVPELSPQSLVAALKVYETGQAAVIAEKPLTRQEAAKLLAVSVNTVDRYIRHGLLAAVNMGPRLVRIDPQSVEALLHGTAENNVEG